MCIDLFWSYIWIQCCTVHSPVGVACVLNIIHNYQLHICNTRPEFLSFFFSLPATWHSAHTISPFRIVAIFLRIFFQKISTFWMRVLHICYKFACNFILFFSCFLFRFFLLLFWYKWIVVGMCVNFTLPIFISSYFSFPYSFCLRCGLFLCCVFICFRLIFPCNGQCLITIGWKMADMACRSNMLRSRKLANSTIT